MSDRKLKVIVLTHGGSTRLLELLAVDKRVEIAGIFVETAVQPERSLKQKFKRSIRYDGYRATVKKFSAKVFGLKTADTEDTGAVQKNQDELEKCATELKIPLVRVDNFHDHSTIELLKAANADLGILSGTNIIKKEVFSIPRLGSINIHQGNAPFYRGGPPVFWELYNGEKNVGITVHFVAAKVDTGDIILQKMIPIEYDFDRYALDYERFLADYRISLREPSARMLAAAVAAIADGVESRTKQDATLGKRYRLPVKAEKDMLVRILKKRQKETANWDVRLSQRQDQR